MTLSLICLYPICSQNIQTVDGKKMFIKSNENITPGFKIFNLCEEQKGSKNCAEFYLKPDGSYSKLPITKSQLINAVKTNKFSAIKDIKKIAFSGNSIYYFQNTRYNTYLAFDEASNLVIFPVSTNADPIAIGRKAGISPEEALDNKCNKACPINLPPGCPNDVSKECWLRAWDKTVRCILKCKGKIRMTNIAPFEGIVINTKAN